MWSPYHEDKTPLRYVNEKEEKRVDRDREKERERQRDRYHEIER